MSYRTVPVSLLRIHKSGVEIGKPRQSQFEKIYKHNFFFQQYLENCWSYGSENFNGFLLLSHPLSMTPTVID
jgi:hypothetical protein